MIAFPPPQPPGGLQMSRSHPFRLVLAAALVFGGCLYFEAPTGPTYAEELELGVLQWQEVLAVGDSALLSVELLDESGAPFTSSQVTLHWWTSDPTVTGLHPGPKATQKWALGFSAGTATIRIEARQAAEGGRGGQRAIRVEIERMIEVRLVD